MVGSLLAQLTAAVPGFAPVAEKNVICRWRDLAPSRLLLSQSAGSAPAADATRGSGARRSWRVAHVYVHVDLDVLDESEGLVNAYSGGAGLVLADLLRCIDIAASRIPLAAAALTAYDPRFDRTGSVSTAALAVAESLASHAPRPSE